MICERHNLLVEIEKTSDQKVLKVTSLLERTVRNRSAYPQPLRQRLAIDDVMM
jgi:hypothetical protein